MEKKRFDIAVIGGGPGGYVAAIRAAHSGKSVALIESGDLGGVCLNWGCIPTKTLIASAHALHLVQHADKFGIETGQVSFDYSAMKLRKDKTVKEIRTSLEGLIRSHSVTIIRGFASFDSPNVLKVRGEEETFVDADKIIIATGSTSREIPAFPFDHRKVLSAQSMLEVTELPERLAIIGGGVIGCEFASLYADLGVKVTVLEAMDRIISTESPKLSTLLQKSMHAQGIKVKTGVRVTGVDTSGPAAQVLTDGESIDADLVLVAVGVQFSSKGLGLEKIGVATDERGAILVNERMETSLDHIYAIGDVTGRSMLAHTASHAGIIAAVNALGGSAIMRYDVIPSVIFTRPEIASVGLTLESAKAKGFDATEGSFPFAALGKSKALGETEGFAEIVIDRATGAILGASVVGFEASTLIAEMAVAIENELTAETIYETVHAHPTLSEAWMEAAHIATGQPIHFPPRKR
jgi:dihydrolipoamide dehydrogenase